MVAHQAPLSMEFPRQEYWSGLPFPSPGDLPHPGFELVSPALAGGFFTTQSPGKPCKTQLWHFNLTLVAYVQWFWCVYKSQPFNQWPHLTCSWVFAPSVNCGAPDPLHPVPLTCLCAQPSQQTELLEEGKQVTPPLSSSNPLCKSGRRRNACSILVLSEFTAEILSSLSPGWGLVGLWGPHTGVSQVICRLWGVK